MRLALIALLSLSFAPAASAQGMPVGMSASVPGAIAGGKIVSFDSARKVIVVEYGGQKTTLDISKAPVAGNLVVGAIVDVTYANGVASAVSVRSAPQGGEQAGAQQAGGQSTGGAAVAGGAISGAKVVAFDAAKRLMTVDAGGQKFEINVANAVVSGNIAVGKIVDVSQAGGVASAVSVRP